MTALLEIDIEKNGVLILFLFPYGTKVSNMYLSVHATIIPRSYDDWIILILLWATLCAIEFFSIDFVKKKFQLSPIQTFTCSNLKLCIFRRIICYQFHRRNIDYRQKRGKKERRHEQSHV